MKKIFSSTLFILVLLFILSFIIRIYKVDTAPTGLLIDEVSHGYNAYSILKTGKDEHGVSYPLVFKAFGDQKLPAYTYILIPFIKVFDLSPLAVRLPSVLIGSLLPLIIYLLIRELGFKKHIGFMCGIITAISPWTIILSRFGYESNLGLFFFTIGLWLYFVSIRKKRIHIAILDGLFFALSLYSYISFRFITPVILFSILAIGGNLNKVKVSIIISFIIFSIPLSSLFFSSQGAARFTQISTLGKEGLTMEINENRAYCSEHLPKIICYIASNKALFTARSYLYRYIEVFSPEYLFLTGETNSMTLNVKDFGLFYVWLLPIFWIGIFSMIYRILNKKSTSIEIFILLGCLVTVTPSLLVDAPHKLRLSGLYPFICVIFAHGLSSCEALLVRSQDKIVSRIIFYSISLISVLFFLTLYLAVYVQKEESAFRTYVPKLMKYLGANNQQTEVYIKSISEGIIYYAFTNKVNPDYYQKNVKIGTPDGLGFAHATDLGTVHITEKTLNQLRCSLQEINKPTLYVSSENILTIPDISKKIIYSENGVDSLAVIYDLNKINKDLLSCEQISN